MVRCNYFNSPGGCRRGSSCNFEHSNGAPAVVNGRGGRGDGGIRGASRGGFRGGGRGGFQQPRDTRYSPNGVCRSYWHDGACQRGADCKYQHVRSGAGVNTGDAESSTDAVAQQLQQGSLSTNDLHAVDGAAKFGRFERILELLEAAPRPGDPMAPSTVYVFANGLLSTTKEDAAWSFQDAQSILARLARVPGHLNARLRDIFAWPVVSTRSGGVSGSLIFQHSFLPLFLYLASDTVLNSTSAHHVNAIFTLLDANASLWAPKTTTSLHEMIGRGFVRVEGAQLLGTAFQPKGFLEVIIPLAKVLSEYLARFDTALVTHGAALTDLVEAIETGFDAYYRDVLSATPTFQDAVVLKMETSTRKFVLDEQRRVISRLSDIIERVQGRRGQRTGAREQQLAVSAANDAALARLRQIYDGPGELARQGPRHDNDCINIADIDLLPTHAELMCQQPIFLPSNIPSAPHHLAAGSMERQLDIVFRLLRENSVGPIRSAVQSLLLDLRGPQATKLQAFLQAGGGRWRSADASNAVDLNVYGDVRFNAIAVLQNELIVEIGVKAPRGAGSGREVNKKLGRGGLVGLPLRQVQSSGAEELRVFLGEVCEDASWSGGRGSVKVAFHDVAVFTDAMDRGAGSSSPMYFFEVPGMLLGTLLPFLKSLQHIEPSSIPFGQYIASSTDATSPLPAMEPPRFARSPAFSYDLSSFLKPGSLEDGLRMVATNATSVEHARSALKAHSAFDSSQAEAFIDCMCREVAMIQGPPGTGKSWIGVKLVQMLLEQNIKSIFVLAYTNHALDQFLHDLYDNATTDIIRCGSRSKDPIIQALNLFDACKDSGVGVRLKLRQEIRDQYAKREEIEKELKAVCAVASIANSHHIRYSDIADLLRADYPLHAALLSSVPLEVIFAHEEQTAGGWQVVGQERGGQRPPPQDAAFTWWKAGWDIDVLKTQKAAYEPRTRHESFEDGDEANAEPSSRAEAEEEEEELPAWMLALFNDDEAEQAQASTASPVVPLNPFADWIEPHQNRSLRRLLASNDVWGFSKAERLRIVEHWVQETRRREIPKLERLRAHHSQVTSEIAALHNQRKKDVLSNAKIIGATTNGAANLLPLLKAAAPRILIVEEAGECLEAHVLATMVPSIEQIILIGDPLQLRPHIENDQLSVDSSVGKLYRLDESLFERLVNAKLPYSTLATQRRMRPEIASLVRNHLYPSLTDHTAVLNYPSLKGLGRNCFFLDHAHGEDKQQRDSSSKTNTYEARMAVDLVVHFIKQGYKPGDIAVLSPYLGQVKMLKQLLSTAKLEVELDERDVRELNRMADDVSDDEDEEDLTPRKFESRTADLLVTLRSVDNFQGEEAKVVILSLVRNAGASEDEEGVVTLDKVARASIGFLKSENRSNVALSRAKHGMVIIGNATLFRERAPMWESVISTLEEQDAVGEALPIRCEQHPEETSLVKEPGMIAQVAPQGGCLKRCSTEMRCGHLCPRLCHPTDKVHANTRCIEPCQIRLDCGHVCRSLCGDPHVCDWIEPAVALPCGHRRINVPCAEAQNVEELECRTQVVVALPCEHTVTVECGTSVVDYVCKQPCGLALSCKHGTCKERCGSCRPPRFYSEPSSVVNHGRHRCEKILSCSHACLGDCKTHLEKGDCGPCQATCDRGCEHGRCTHKCGRAGCRSCPNPCSWTCEHVGPCENSCAMPCSRLPCDEPCRNVLACSHLCPSVCGENCAAQICPTCATPEQKSQVVDLLMMTTLGEVDLEEEGIDNRILTLSCGHAFTVETLDGIFELEKHYSRGPDERWAALKEVQPDALRPFSCPQCKTAIATSSAKRYGRPLKLVDLGAQEELALMRSSRSLGSIGQALAAFEVTAVLLPASELRTLASPKSNSKASRDFQRRYARVKSLVTPFIAYTLEPHGVSPTIAAIWTTATEPLVRLYRMAEDLVTSRSPHVNAYDSAFAKLQRQAKDELRQLVGEAGGDISAHDVQEEAYRRAKLAIGAPMPRAENRSAVEGVWMSLQIRLSLFDIGQSLFEELSALSPSQLPGLDLSIRRLQVFLYFLLTSSRRDAYSCVDLARFNAATRQEITSLLHVARLSLKIARYDCEQHVASAKRGEAYIVAQVVADIEQRQAVAEDDLDAAIERARDSMRGNRMAMRSLDEWLDTSTWGTVGVLAKEWSNLIEYAKSADFYAEVTEEEKRLIVEAMAPTFGHWSSGTHWYRCPQGHPFVIGDCGQANQAGVCPECGATLGGQGHHGSRMAAGTVVDDTLQGLHRATRTV